MSKVTESKINCSNCSEEISVNIYNSVNSLLDSELAEKLMNNELTIATCKCGQIHQLNYPILFNKMGLGHSIMVQYTQEDKEDVAKQFQMTNRALCHISSSIKTVEVYNDWNEFIERVKVLELND